MNAIIERVGFMFHDAPSLTSIPLFFISAMDGYPHEIPRIRQNPINDFNVLLLLYCLELMK